MPVKLIETAARAFNIPPESLSESTEFRTLLHWDSFAALALVYGIEDAFGVLLGYGALNEVTTLGQLNELIATRLRHSG
ncbi:MAG: acyl carrier protein [Thauera sp.]|nr:acyl carrier protein [Thauera sp.]